MRYDVLSTYLAYVCLGFLGFSIQHRGLYLAFQVVERFLCW